MHFTYNERTRTLSVALAGRTVLQLHDITNNNLHIARVLAESLIQNATNPPKGGHRLWN